MSENRDFEKRDEVLKKLRAEDFIPYLEEDVKKHLWLDSERVIKFVKDYTAKQDRNLSMADLAEDVEPKTNTMKVIGTLSDLLSEDGSKVYREKYNTDGMGSFIDFYFKDVGQENKGIEMYGRVSKDYVESQFGKDDELKQMFHQIQGLPNSMSFEFNLTDREAVYAITRKFYPRTAWLES